jgi:diguanylate cyclase (GGDEF)-like protein
MRVLIVDDSELERVRIKAYLESLGYEITLATNGLDALETFAAIQPDLVLLDVVMPHMDGLETARRIRALPIPWVPIIFLSGNTEPEDIASGIEAGGDDYLCKPLSNVILGAKLLAMRRILAFKPGYEVSTDDLGGAQFDLDLVSGFVGRRAGERMLMREFVRCSRSIQSVSVVLVGIDDYAALLDRSGQSTLNLCLKRLSETLRSNAARMTDFIFRHDARSFCIVMPDTPMTGAVRVAERIRLAVESQDVPGESLPFAFTVSVGVATAIPQKDASSQHLANAAEGMLEQAQQEGGNRVHAAAADVPFRLTARELECLQWSAIGKSSWEISTILCISESAVNFHMANIRSKFDVSSRRQAVVQAIRFGLIRPA